MSPLTSDDQNNEDLDPEDVEAGVRRSQKTEAAVNLQKPFDTDNKSRRSVEEFLGNAHNQIMETQRRCDGKQQANRDDQCSQLEADLYHLKPAGEPEGVIK